MEQVNQEICCERGGVSTSLAPLLGDTGDPGHLRPHNSDDSTAEYGGVGPSHPS